MTTMPPSSSRIGDFTALKSQILVVDDNPTILHLLSTLLEKEEYLVTKAVNGQEAMKLLGDQPEQFDIILLDRMMPIMDGMEVISAIQADDQLKNIPIIMQTAADKPEEISEGIKAGVFYYLTKPVDRKTLLSVVSAAVKQAGQQRTLRAEMQRHRNSFGLMEVVKCSFRTLEEGEGLSSFLANCFPDPERALSGISELLINAVEHGNLGITYDKKTALMDENSWRGEINRLLDSPEHADKKVVVIFEKKNSTYYFQVTDQGKGFNWKQYLEFDPSRASHNHGRGIAMANMIAFDKVVYNEKGNQVTAVMKEKAVEKNDSDDDYWG